MQPSRIIDKTKKSSNLNDCINSETDSADSDQESFVDWRQSGKNRVELVSGYGVYVDYAELRDIRKRWLSKPKELVRRLLKQMIERKKLLKMTRVGRGGGEAIPKRVLKAIRSR